MKKNISFLFIFFSFTIQVSVSQNVSINTTGVLAKPSAGLDVDFPNKGMLIPRVSLSSILDTITIPGPTNALLVFNTNSNILNGNGVGFYFYCSLGCSNTSWKFIKFSDTPTSSNTEWTFFTKQTFLNYWTGYEFSSLPTHDKWKLVFDIQNPNPLSGYGMSVSIRLNGVTNQIYGTKYVQGQPSSYSSNWLIYQGFEGIAAFSGDVIITGKYFSNKNSKMFSARLCGNELYNTKEALSGFLLNDPNNLNKISILTPDGPITGSIELWYKDNH